MARLYANENFPLPVVQFLRQSGHDVVTVQETGRGGESTPDDAVLQLAALDSRAVITLNRRDFILLHLSSPAHMGIIVCTVDPDFEALANRVDQAIRVHQPIEGQLLRVNRPSK